MDTRAKMTGFFIAMFVMTVLIEVFALRRWSNRRGSSVFSLCVAAFSGIVSLVGWMMIDWGDNQEALAQEPPTSGEKMLVLILLFLIFTIFALIPTGTTAFIYNKFGKEFSNQDTI